MKIVEYINFWGNVAYGVVFKGERNQDRYEQETRYINKPRVIWRKLGKQDASRD